MSPNDKGSVLEKPGNSYYDCNTGQWRTRGEQDKSPPPPVEQSRRKIKHPPKFMSTKSDVKSAVELALQQPAPVPVPLPTIKLPDLIPLQSDVDAIVACNGGNEKLARHRCTQEVMLRLERLRIVCPAAAARIEADRKTALDLLTRSVKSIAELSGLADRLESALTQRAALLHALDGDVASLAHAKEQLASIAALDLPHDQLVVLNTLTQQLPKRIAERRAAVAVPTEEIKLLLGQGDLDGAAVLKVLYEATGVQPGGHCTADPQSRALHAAGYFALPE
ncbi:MAG: hypothetical protein NT154_18815 [Verrucomicrobia bacterium]|nr:hypothetical protein [Verrucomicrobiota bacterium]